ncbi:MAG: ABC transporter permease [Propionibacterium sp.]|nr:ABC transporter permease [Propionibacterium sp.]
MDPLRALRRLAGRLAAALLALAAVGVGVLVLADLSPRDPLASYLGSSYLSASADSRTEAARALGLDVAWWQAGLAWLQGLPQGDLGVSRVMGRPVGTVLAESLPWTLGLALPAFVLALAVSLAVVLRANLRPGGVFDRAVQVLTGVLAGLPAFLVALGVIALFAGAARLLGVPSLPASGAYSPGARASGLEAGDVALHGVIPLVAFTLSLVPSLVAHLQQGMASAMGSDSAQAARGLGVRERTVLTRVVLPQSALPLVGAATSVVASLVATSAIVEQIFGWPGVGAATIAAALESDLALLLATSLGTALVVIVAGWLGDAVARMVDPRVRRG